MPFEPIAIVGRACVLPGATTPEALWAAVRDGRDLLDSAPAGRWGIARDRILADARGDTADRAVSDRGGYVSDFDSVFDPSGFGIPESEVLALDPLFQWTFHCARQALRDAGESGGARAGAVFGNLSFPSAGMARFAETAWLKGQEDAQRLMRDASLAQPHPRNRFMSGLPALLLQRAVGLKAGAFALDAACASALYAIKLACDRLRDGEADLMLAGAVNRADDLFIHVGFTALGALSPEGRSRPFNRNADGLVPAEGAAFVALKRLDDAERDGNTIHGVIRAVGLANDGRGRGLLQPAEEGQARAMTQAYNLSGLSPSDISLLECHATGTPVGDGAEIRSTSEVFAGCSDVPLGSLKSNLGHLITVAGVAGLIKVIEAMRAGQRPPTLHVEEPIEALNDSPFRLLDRLEAWPSDGPRRAAVSAFGFGGNNAHLIVEEHVPGPGPALAKAARPAPVVAIVGVGAVIGRAQGRAAVTEALFGETSLVGEDGARCDAIDISLAGLKFPPNDLEQSLGQQLLVLAAAREAVADVSRLPRESTGVLVGMEADPEVARFGARWRTAEWAEAWGAGETWTANAREQFVKALESPGVLGTMPNICANRLNSQLDLGGQSFTVSAEELSGLHAMQLGVRALQRGELDAAITGAVDLSCQEPHRAAAAELLPEDRQLPGDAAVVLVLKRLEDARRDGDTVYAVVDDEQSDAELRLGLAEGYDSLTQRFGHAHAASALVHIAAAALSLHHRTLPGGRPWLSSPPRRASVEVEAMEGARCSVRLRELPERTATSNRARPRLHIYSGADANAVLDELEAGRQSDVGPARLVLVADSDEQLEQRTQRARAHLRDRAPAGPGVHFQKAPIDGELAFVFSAAGAAYHGMGRELLRAMPELGDELSQRFSGMPAALGWAYGDVERRPGVLEQLWGASAVCQLHAELSQGLLGLRPQAAIGYSSGESNALYALGAWTDLDAMIHDARSSGLFERELGGDFEAVQRAWNDEASWTVWNVRLSPAAVRAEIIKEPRVHLSIVHSPEDCVIAGDATACERVVAALGTQRCQRLGYELAVHVPELEQVRDAWHRLHLRPVTPVPGVRFYSNANNAAYEASSAACADAITGQAVAPIDFSATIERAWADGVRVFVEHGPHNACSRWIRETLGDRQAVVVSFDRKHAGIEQVLDAVAALVAAGVPVEHRALSDRLGTSSKPTAGPSLRLPVHPVPVRLPELPQHSDEDRDAMQTMDPAPTLPPILEPAVMPTIADPTAVPTPVAAVPVAPGPPVQYVSPGAGTAMTAEVAALHGHAARTALLHQEFLTEQAALHQQFLALRQEAVDTLLRLPPGGGLPITVEPAVSTRAVVEPALSPAPVMPQPQPQPQPQPANTLPEPQVIKRRAPTGLTLGREQLLVHASGKISDIYGPQFKNQDGFARQVRMPEPPLLLADRVTGLDAEPGSMARGTIWTETDVNEDSWYLHHGRMPAGIMIEAGQADLMLISYLGIDALNHGERVYRLLGCQLTYHDELPRPGETLTYDIHVDGHAQQGDVRLFFFHYDCHVGDGLRLSVRQGQAGFFTDAELRDSAGVLWDPADADIVPEPRLDEPPVACHRSSFDAEQVRAFADGRPWDCFGAGFELARTHTRTPRSHDGKMLFLEQVNAFDVRGGPWQRGYLRAEAPVQPDDWYFAGHFKNDPCMPGTLMFEGCLQAMAFYMTGMGLTLKRDGWRFQPVSDEPFDLRCRGQVLPDSKNVTYEIFVEEVIAGPVPTVYADLLCTVDGLKAFHAKRVGLQMVPDWPLTSQPELLHDHVETKAVASHNGFDFGYESLLACAWGKPSDAFGEMYQPFDGHRAVARLPGPPYHFLSRVTHVNCPPGEFKAGASIELEYDIPQDAWYFDQNGCRSMPFAVLLEAALQPCGWLASYVGSALQIDEDLSFRNLDGTGTLLDELHCDAGTLRTRVTLTNISRSAGMIIESFDVECFLGERKVYDLQTVFGFFPLAALQNQVGLPTTDAQRNLLTEPSDFAVDLTSRPSRYCAEAPRLADSMLLMLDRVTGFWPQGGDKGLGTLRAEKRVDPSEWFFKAHFFQDPVQPGSLGLEALVQLLQFYMLETGMQGGVEEPRFEPLALDVPMTWKYRGQVVPSNEVIQSTLEVVETGTDERGAYAIAEGSLWVDGKRIYESTKFGMRIVTGDAPTTTRDTVLDPTVDTWLGDHRPTWTVPALPMMSMVEALAAGNGPVTGLRDVSIRRWLVLDRAHRLRTEADGERLRLLASTGSGEEEIATGRVLSGDYAAAPAPLPAFEGEASDSPYTTGMLFHGPAFQLQKRLIMGEGGSSSWLDAAGGGLPMGQLNPALLDAATHGIPHDRLHLWSSEIADDVVAYPARISELDIYGPTPRTGEVRCEARFDGFAGSTSLPRFLIQLIVDERVWLQMRLIEACFPKGRLGAVAPVDRRAFLRDHTFVEGISLAEQTEGRTRLTQSDIDGTDWLPGTVAVLYGSRDLESVAIKEHLAAEHQIHPGKLPEALPLTRNRFSVESADGTATVQRTGSASLDIAPVRDFWSAWFNREPWPVEDLYYGLIERFVERVVLDDPAAFAAIKGRSALYLANHQTGVESLLFSIIASAIGKVPTVTLAKAEHRHTWLGKLIAHCFSYPGVADPNVITFFDREDRTSLPRIIGELAAEMAGPGKSVMVHVEGTRALSCRPQVKLMSGAFIDMALKVGAPIVPVRFVGGLPVEPVETRLEFPVGMGKQEIWFGRPLLAEELRCMPYGERKQCVIAAINGLGPDNADEQPLPGDASFDTSVQQWVDRTDASQEHAVLLRTLQQVAVPCAETARLLAAADGAELSNDGEPHDLWLAELGRRLLGQR